MAQPMKDHHYHSNWKGVHMIKLFIFLVFTCFPISTIAGLIDFETNASGTLPYDNEPIAISDVFTINNINIQFGFDSNLNGSVDTSAVFESEGETGDTNDTAYWVRNQDKDTAASGYEAQLGDFFIRQFKPYKPFGEFVILLDSNLPVTHASGEIWDIDGNRKTEQFLIKAFNQNTLLEQIYSPLGDNHTLDGKPWTFSFANLTDIEKITIAFTGTKNSGIGIAFNNFSAESITTNNFNTQSFGLSPALAQVNEPNILLLMMTGFVFCIYFVIKRYKN